MNNKKKFPVLINIGICFILFVGFLPYIHMPLYAFMTTGWLRGVVFTLGFIFFQLKIRQKNDYDDLTYASLFAFVLFAGIVDTAGNSFFNKPLEWITSPLGTLSFVTNIDTFGGTVAYGVKCQILQSNGNVISVPTILLLLYRVVQYVLWFGFIGFINEKTLIKLERRLPLKWYRRKPFHETIDADLEEKMNAEIQNREKMKQKKEISAELYMHLKELKAEGNTIKAIKVLRNETDQTWSIQEAKDFIDNI